MRLSTYTHHPKALLWHLPAKGHHHTLSSKPLETPLRRRLLWHSWHVYELHLGFLSHRLSQRGASWVSRPPDSDKLSVNPLRHLQQVRPIWHFPKYSNQPLVFPAWNYGSQLARLRKGEEQSRVLGSTAEEFRLPLHNHTSTSGTTEILSWASTLNKAGCAELA